MAADTTSSTRSVIGRSLPNWLVAVSTALAVGLVVAPFAYIGHRRSTEQLQTELVAVADEHMSRAVSAHLTGLIEPPENAWLVNPVDQWANPLSEDAWTSPPVFRLAEQALEYDAYQTEYEFDGQWLASSRAVGGDHALVVVVDANQRDQAITGSARRWFAGWLLAAVLAGAAGWFGARGIRRRLQAPVERAHMVNRDFIADAAHELRTPLSIIQASAGHALARERSSDAYQESLAEILAAAERAGSSVGELLEFARLEADQGSLRLAPLRLDLLAEEVAVSVRADDTTVEMTPAEAVVVEADYNLIRQVVENITRNAVARADKVTLSARNDEGWARIDVADNGPGFDPGMIDYVFERFRRGDRSGSAGLGMAIARTIVDLHGGRCQAQNIDDGGALVSIWLPIEGS